MEITSTILSKLSDNEIYIYLLNVITYLSYKYNYLNISSELMDKIIYEEIALSRDNYKNNGDYKNYMMHRLESKIIALGTKFFNDNDSTYGIIDSYINKYFSVPENYDTARSYLKKLSELFSQFSYVPEPATIISLINNNKIFLKILELIVSNHANYFKDHSPFGLFADNNIASLIGIYCMVKNINVGDDYQIEEDDNVTDSLSEYLSEIDAIPPITFTEMQEICKRIKLGDQEARNRLTEGNLKLVVMIAKVIFRVNKTVPILDLINAGNIGLMKAASKFDIDLGFRFSTYATYWIRTEIIREIQNNGRTIKISIHMHGKINNYNRLKEELLQTKGTDISYQEIAKSLNMPLDKVMEYEKYRDPVISLNTLVNSDGDAEMIDFVSDDEFIEAEELHNLSIEMQKLFKECELTDKQIKVLTLRYGFLDGFTRTLEEVGNILGVKKQAIAQQEAKALYKLRIYEGTKGLAEYMDNPDKALKILKRFNIAYNDNKLNQKKINPLVDEVSGYNTVKRR